MPLRVSNAVFAYACDFIAISDSDYFPRQVAAAMETKILSIIDWDIIPKVLLIDEIVTLVKRMEWTGLDCPRCAGWDPRWAHSPTRTPPPTHTHLPSLAEWIGTADSPS
jgi:hypothetical protein